MFLNTLNHWSLIGWQKVKRNLSNTDGMGTIEIVLIIAVLVGLALIFKDSIGSHLMKLIENFKGVEIDPASISN